MIKSLFLVFIGGGIGSCMRFIISKYITSDFSKINPNGTLSANIVASFFLGLIVYHFAEKPYFNDHLRLLLITGFCGGFSTFSTFSYETYAFLKMHLYIYAVINILVSIFLGIFVMYSVDKYL